MTLRPIKAVALPPNAKRATDYGERPKPFWVAPTSLYVDDEYQRDLNRRSMALIAKIVAGFSWAKIDPPVVVREAGRLHVLDGQHTAIAAATLEIPKILVIEVIAAGGFDRADAFVSHNRDHLTMTAIDVYRAQLGGKHPDAVRVARVCADAGVRIRVISHAITPRVGDSAAISAIGKVTAKRGPAQAARILAALVSAGRAPVSSAEIVAADEFVCGADAASEHELLAAAKAIGPDGLLRCHARATTERISTKVAILDAYRKARRQRAA